MTANPQKENGFTGIANETMDNLCKLNLSNYESRIIHAIFRKTYGWNKKADIISLSQFSVMTNIKTQHVARTVKELVNRNIIKVNYLTPQSVEYSFQKDYDLWDKKTPLDVVLEAQLLPNEVVPEQVVPNEDTGSPYLGSQVVPKQVVTKDTIQKTLYKNNITKESNIFNLPEWISKETWDAFVEMRKKIKSPLTDYAKYLAIKKLTAFRESGEDPNEILDKAILGTWKGIYSLKDRNNGGQNHGINQTHPQQTTAERIRASLGKPLD